MLIWSTKRAVVRKARFSFLVQDPLQLDVAAEVAVNRKVRGLQEFNQDDRTPYVTQIYVEPEFRKQGYASQALSLLLRDHGEVKVDGPSNVALHILEGQGFVWAGFKDGTDGRPIVAFARKGIHVKM